MRSLSVLLVASLALFNFSNDAHSQEVRGSNEPLVIGQFKEPIWYLPKGQGIAPIIDMLASDGFKVYGDFRAFEVEASSGDIFDHQHTEQRCYSCSDQPVAKRLVSVLDSENFFISHYYVQAEKPNESVELLVNSDAVVIKASYVSRLNYDKGALISAAEGRYGQPDKTEQNSGDFILQWRCVEGVEALNSCPVFKMVSLATGGGFLTEYRVNLELTEYAAQKEGEILSRERARTFKATLNTELGQPKL